MRFYLRLASALGMAALGSAALAGDIQTGASLELNFTHNFNRPSGTNTVLGYPSSQNQTGYFFNRRAGTFAVNLAEFRLYKEADENSRAGFSLRLIDGEVAKQISTEVNTTNNASRAVGNIPGSSAALFYEAYGRALVNDRLTMDMGIFQTWVGVEGIGIGNSQFLSRSFQKGQFQPFYHSGLRAAYKASEKTTVTGAVLNAFNGTERSPNRRDLSLGFQVAHRISDDEMLHVNGVEAKDDTLIGRSHDIFNLVYTNRLNDTTAIALDASMTNDTNAGQRVRGYGYTGYLTHTLSNGNVLGLRGEFLNEDRAGGSLLAFGGTRKPSLNSITASYELKNDELKGLRTILELRFDSANSAIFPSRTGAKKNQTTLSLVQAFSF